MLFVTSCISAFFSLSLVRVTTKDNIMWRKISCLLLWEKFVFLGRVEY